MIFKIFNSIIYGVLRRTHTLQLRTIQLLNKIRYYNRVYWLKIVLLYGSWIDIFLE